MAGINWNAAARNVAKQGLEKLDANAGEGYISRLMGGLKEFGDDMLGGNDIYEKMVGFSGTKAAGTTERIALDSEKGMNAMKDYQAQLARQQERLQGKMDEFNPANRGSSNEHTDKMYDRYRAQYDAVKAENDKVLGYGSMTPEQLAGQTHEIHMGPTMGSKTKNLGENIKSYYTEGDASTLATRAGVTLGVYGAGAVGMRYASGGNLTTNANGESDIAGIPFI